MFRLFKSIIKTLLFIFIGVPILLMCWNYISTSSSYLDQSPLLLEQSTSSDGASKEEQIAELEQKKSLKTKKEVSMDYLARKRGKKKPKLKSLKEKLKN